MCDALIGHTGFVGGNLAHQRAFCSMFNSKSIQGIKNRQFDLVVSAGTYGEMWIANQNPEKDLDQIEGLMGHLKTITAKKFVLISTIEVYNNPIDTDEDSPIVVDSLKAYGRNRFLLEEFVKSHFENHLIVRLPNLFGRNLKKNFLYDLENRAPAFLTPSRYSEILALLGTLEQQCFQESYVMDKNLNYRLREGLTSSCMDALIKSLDRVNATSLAFTHSQSRFQFYDLSCLWRDIQKSLDHGLTKVNFATEPIWAEEIAQRLFGFRFENKTERPPVNYNFRTKYYSLLGGQRGYLYTSNEVFQQIHDFFKHFQVRGKQ